MIQSREMFEAVELTQLAPYAQASRLSRGREYPEEEAPYRSVFARDRDRVIHTTAFRRLEYKTQVFVNSEGDHYRTRLTHTLEVAQIGRSIARALRANEDLVEAVALAHDLGHTPFGHAGEETLHDLMADHGGFDHNRQSLRIVEKLERRYPDFPGLNLTWEVREGIMKHKTDYDQGAAEGYDSHLMATLEGQIVNAADETAYNTHDLDDGLRAGILRPSILKGIALWEEALDRVGYVPSDYLPDLVRYRIVRYLIGREVEDLVHETDRQLGAVGIDSVDKVRKLGRNVVDFSAEMKGGNRQLKDCLLHNFYLDYRLMRKTAKARHIIMRMFEAYCQEPRQLPDTTQALLEGRDLYRVVCDYIAGMTDRYAAQEYSKLFDALEWA
jgi:dGTPase